MPSGRSCGGDAVGRALSVYPLASLLGTVTCSGSGSGVVPGPAAGKLNVGWSRAIESTGWMSTSTPAEPLDPLGGGVTEQALAAAEAFCGSGAAVAKSDALSSVSVQPPPARASAFVALPAGAAPLPS